MVLWRIKDLIWIFVHVFISFIPFENTVDPDQISWLLTKATDQDPHCFHFDSNYMVTAGMLQVNSGLVRPLW